MQDPSLLLETETESIPSNCYSSCHFEAALRLCSMHTRTERFTTAKYCNHSMPCDLGSDVLLRALFPPRFTLESKFALDMIGLRPEAWGPCNIGALKIRIGFSGPIILNFNKEPAKVV